MNREREEIIDETEPLDAYFQDVSRYPSRLNYKQEQIAFGYLQDARSIQDLAGSDRFRAAVKPGEENKFQQAFADSRDIRNFISLCNLRLVIHFAPRYVTSRVKLTDLVDEGNIGLMRAIDKFDPTRETRFSTYAVHWIKQALGRYQEDQSTTIRLPSHMHQNMRYLHQLSEEFAAQNNRLPTRLELKESFIKRVPAAVASTAETAYQVWQSNFAAPVSLDKSFYPDDPDGEETLADHVPGRADTEKIAVRIVYNQALHTGLAASLERLDPRKRRIIELLYLTNHGQRESLSKIGDKMDPHLSREKVRQLRNEALIELSQNGDLRALHKELLV